MNNKKEKIGKAENSSENKIIIKLGIDEAGRGPVIGPMVMAGCATTAEIDNELKTAGVRDSKLVLPKKREALYSLITSQVLAYHIVELSPDEIDGRDKKGLNLNQLEAVTSISIIREIKKKINQPFVCIMDSPTNTPAPYVEYIRTKLNDPEIMIVAETKADVNHVSVSAASILAKVTRDKRIDDLKTEVELKFGKLDIGSGYPSDPITQKFIKDYWNKVDFVRGGFFRKTWATWKEFAGKAKQKGLGEF